MGNACGCGNKVEDNTAPPPKDQPKKEEPKKTEPKKTEPKKAEPKKATTDDKSALVMAHANEIVHVVADKGSYAKELFETTMVKEFKAIFGADEVFLCEFEDFDWDKELEVIQSTDSSAVGKKINNKGDGVYASFKADPTSAEIQTFDKPGDGAFFGNHATAFVVVIPLVTKGHNNDKVFGAVQINCASKVDIPEGMLELAAEVALKWKILDLRKKMLILANQALLWLISRTSFDNFRVGFLDTKEHQVYWKLVRGTPFELDDDTSNAIVKGMLDDDESHVNLDHFHAYIIQDDELQINSENKLKAVVIVEKNDAGDDDCDVIVDAFHMLEKLLVRIKDEDSDGEEEEDEEEEEDGEDSDGDDDDSDVSDDDDDDIKDDEVDETVEFGKNHHLEFYEALAKRAQRRLIKLTRSHKAEMVSFSKPPKGVKPIIQAALYIMGVPKKDCKTWRQCRKMMKLKFRYKFKALKDIQPADVKKSVIKRAEKKLDGVSFKEMLAVSKPTTLVLSFCEIITAYSLAINALEDLEEDKESDKAYTDYTNQ